MSTQENNTFMTSDQLYLDNSLPESAPEAPKDMFPYRNMESQEIENMLDIQDINQLAEVKKFNEDFITKALQQREDKIREQEKQSSENSYKDLGLHAVLKKLGPTIVAALEDPTINEIMLNDDGSYFFESNRGMQRIDTLKSDDVETVIRNLASILDLKVDLEEKPIISGDIPSYHVRFEAVLPPLSPRPIFSFRRHQPQVINLIDFEPEPMPQICYIELLRTLYHRNNVLICGTTGSGKTTFLNSYLAAAAQDYPYERVVSIEDVPELKLTSANHTSLFYSDKVNMGEVLRTALRLRPDRLAIGEIRGAEALDLVDALSTGHKGSCSTIHAGNPAQALQRLLLLVSRHPDAPDNIRQLICQAIDVIVFLDRDWDGGRRIQEICKVVGYTENDFILESVYSHPTIVSEYSRVIDQCLLPHSL